VNPPWIRAARRTSVVAALLVTSALVLSGCGKKAVDPPIETSNEYVALGDSFTAVAGVGPYADKVCRRSVGDYPHLLAKKLKITSFADVSCGGAQTSDLTQTQLITGDLRGTSPAQLDAVSADTKLITLGIGLNDSIGDSDSRISYFLLQVCLPAKGKLTAECKAYLKQPDTGLRDIVESMGAQVRDGLDLIRERAPSARIVLVGYPRVLPDRSDCADQLPLPAVALERIRTTLQVTNSVLKGVAKKAGADYLDMYGPSEGHDVCSGSPWVNGYKNRAGKAEALHPFESYHRAVADKLVTLLAQD
jgi:hypothetical protein